MSDGTTQRGPTSSGRARQRRKGVARGGRHGLSRPAPIVGENDFVVETGFAVAAPVPARRVAAAPPARSVGISREAEFAYIRSDMRRLIVIAVALLALMLILLVVVSR